MCHVSKDTTTAAKTLVLSKAISASPVPSNMGSDRLTLSKLNTRLSPFRKIAKSARINLNRYWGLLSQKTHQRQSQLSQPQRKGSVSSSVSTSSSMSMDFDHSAEEEQNRINEILEAQANAEEQNSINSQIEYDSSPEPPKRMFVRQRALASSYSSFSSSISSVSSSSPVFQYQYHHQSNQPQSMFDFDNISQDSVFL